MIRKQLPETTYSMEEHLQCYPCHDKEIDQQMAKLHDLFAQARRAQSGGGIGFLGKNKSEFKPHSAALVVEFPKVSAGSAEAALKAGADGLLFTWNGEDSSTLITLKEEIEAARASNTDVVVGLHITEGLDKLDRESLVQIKNQGVQYILLPITAPARLLALETKELEKVVTVPMREGEFYPFFIRPLTTLDGISGVLLDFNFDRDIGSLSIENLLQYQAVRDAVRYPAFLQVKGELDEDGAYVLQALGVQAVILTASSDEDTTREQVKGLREVLEKTYQDERSAQTPSLPKP
jgi:hypothetical protein